MACAPSRIERFNDRLEEYNQALRWATPPRIKSCVSVPKRDSLLPDLSAQLEEENVVDFSVTDVKLDKKTKRAFATVNYTFYRNDTQAVKDRIERLSWEYGGTPEAWYLVARDIVRIK